MKISTRVLRLVAVVCLAWCGSIGAQQLTTPFVANSANSAVNEILMDPPTISQVNTAANSHAKLTSLTALPTPQYLGGEIVDIAVDLFGTDQARGTLIRWIEPTNESPVPPSILWQPDFTAGTLKPFAPTGISNDPAGNLYVVHSTNDPRPGSVWVFRNEDLLSPVPPQPRLIDEFAGLSGSEARILEETVIADVAVGAVSIGDLIVLSREPAMVLLYPGEAIENILADAYNPATRTDVLPEVLIDLGNFDPTGIDFYGNDLLVVTGDGQIVLVDLENLSVDLLVDNLGQGKSRIKTGWQSGQPAVFVTNQNRGSLIRFLLSDNVITQTDEITGLQNPEGLAISAAAFERISNCIVGVSDAFCDPTGTDDGSGAQCSANNHGNCVFGQQVRLVKDDPNDVCVEGGSEVGCGVIYDADSNLLQDFCIVTGDEVTAVLGNLGGALPKIDDFCPGWGDVVNPTIPPELYAEGQPLVFVESTAPGLTITHGLMGVLAEEENLLPEGNADVCPEFRTAWSPSKADDLPVAVGADGDAIFEENLVNCGSHIALGRGGSFWMMGPFTPGATAGAIRAYVYGKFDNLEIVIDAARSQPRKTISQIDRCVATARSRFDRAKNASGYTATIAELDKCDALISALEPGVLTPTLFNNPGGDMVWRIRNIIFTIGQDLL